MDQVNIPAPKELNLSSGNRSRNFDLFKQNWLNFELATELECKEMKRRVASLLSIIGTDALEVYNTFEWIDEEITIQTILEKFERYCKPRKNVTYERFILLTRKQKENEKIDDFVKDLRTLAESCEYGNLKNSIIKDAFVLGVLDNKIRENLLKDCDLDLESAITIARASEKAKEQSSIIHGNDTAEIYKVKKQIKSKTAMISDCKFCGQEHEMKKTSCPAFGKTCLKCKANNHFAVKCRTRNIQEIEKINQSNDNCDESEEFYIH